MNYFYDNALFNGMSNEEFDRMMVCFAPVERHFKSGEIVCDYSTFSDNIGIVQGGQVQVIRIDSDGNRTILENIGDNEVFGKSISFCKTKNDYIEVMCKKDCSVLFIGYRHIIKRCENACIHHSLFVENMLQLMSARAVSLSLRVEILSQRSIRNKLYAYFNSEVQNEIQDKQANGVINFSYSDLADYLCVDRSAMMRELKKMRDDGIVQIDGKNFALN